MLEHKSEPLVPVSLNHTKYFLVDYTLERYKSRWISMISVPNRNLKKYEIDTFKNRHPYRSFKLKSYIHRMSLRSRSYMSALRHRTYSIFDLKLYRSSTVPFGRSQILHVGASTKGSDMWPRCLRRFSVTPTLLSIHISKSVWSYWELNLFSILF